MVSKRHQVLASAAAVMTAVAAGTAVANEGKKPDFPMGQDVAPKAALCDIGPYPHTGKVSLKYCSTLTEGAKCLALIKFSMDLHGNIEPAYHQGKAEYCIEKFKEFLLTPEHE